MSKLSLESLETRETPAQFQMQMIFTNPDGGAEAVRHRMFALVDRTQMAPAADDVWVDGKVITAPNPATARPVEEVAFVFHTIKGGTDGIWLDLGHPVSVPAADGGASVVLQRLANPTPPSEYSAIAFVGGWGSSMYQYAHGDTYSGSHALYQDVTIPAAAGDSYYGTGVYKSVDSGRTW